MQKLLFGFEGRINRAKWWLWSIVVGVAFGVVSGIATALFGASADGTPSPVALAVIAVAAIAYLWSALAIAVKRWHDRNKSGWWILIGLVPVVGGLWYLIECGFLSGTAGPNKYGADPLGTV